MRPPPAFDPYELLGVDASADALAIDRAYKARVRLVHPDLVGDAGLHETKRLNAAREWLLDPELRARLPRPAPRWSTFAADATRARERSPASESPPSSRTWEPPPRPPRPPTPGWSYDPAQDDPLTFDYGPQADLVRAFLESLRALSDDERARLTYSMGDEPPGSFARFEHDLGEKLWSRSRALHDAVSTVWQERDDEIAPYDFPRGRFHGGGPAITNAYAQWLLLGDHLRARPLDRGRLDRLATTCAWPWEASVGQPRYGTHHAGTSAFLRDARAMSEASAERLARSWLRHMGRFVYGTPGEDWFPGSADSPKPELVSARLAAVDASRVRPPDGLRAEHRSAFHAGLRLTAYVLALGGVQDPRRDYLRPWKDAMDASPSFQDRARYGLPLG
jgi:curved DNA-binding protein CbpA